MNRNHKTGYKEGKLLLAAGCVILLFTLYIGKERYREPAGLFWSSRSWQETPAQVTRLLVENGRISVDYRYEFNGAAYGSTRYAFDGRSPAADAFLPGSSVYCFVNPDSPSNAVIDRSVPGRFLLELSLLLLALLSGAVLLGAGLKALRDNRRQRPAP